jgi:hypothetical protein
MRWEDDYKYRGYQNFKEKGFSILETPIHVLVLRELNH